MDEWINRQTDGNYVLLILVFVRWRTKQLSANSKQGRLPDLKDFLANNFQRKAGKLQALHCPDWLLPIKPSRRPLLQVDDSRICLCFLESHGSYQKETRVVDPLTVPPGCTTWSHLQTNFRTNGTRNHPSVWQSFPQPKKSLLSRPELVAEARRHGMIHNLPATPSESGTSCDATGCQCWGSPTPSIWPTWICWKDHHV